MILVMKAFNFLSLKTISTKLKREIIFAAMRFVMKIIWCILFMYGKKIENCMDLLMITDENKLHYVYI